MKAAIGCALLFFLVGCGVHTTPTGDMLYGKMYDVSDGAVLTFEIQPAIQSGAMRAYNPATGERFEGPFTSTYRRGGVSQGTFARYYAEVPDNFGGTSFPSSDLMGILVGDRGTIIEVYLESNTGMLPSGHGIGRDNAGRRYQIHFSPYHVGVKQKSQ